MTQRWRSEFCDPANPGVRETGQFRTNALLLITVSCKFIIIDVPMRKYFWLNRAYVNTFCLLIYFNFWIKRFLSLSILWLLENVSSLLIKINFNIPTAFKTVGICTHIIFFINLLLSWLLLGKTLWPTANVSAGLDLWHCWKLFQSSQINFSLPNAWQRSTRPKGSPDVWLPNSLSRWRDLSYAVNDCYRAINIPKIWVFIHRKRVLKSSIYRHNQ